MGRREMLTAVPEMVGLPVRDAQDRALDAQLLAVDQTPDPLRAAAGVVIEQSPAPGSHLRPGSRVRIWAAGPDDGGNNGGGGTPLPTEPTTLIPSGSK